MTIDALIPLLTTLGFGLHMFVLRREVVRDLHKSD